ncbi:hypothetical protein LQ954_10095 [Sphingomonas sp. IC-11]|uniref:hypothetical protein n=1 Tax=Sphingomonas sp. IC-11 TaxID=2898528 RepID=UPI001E55C322|nr:hypothetical protein [Sphingomonas sp. IC-11]MCD2316499.1 hypothetical protein [Sphingomonas sp. IC-11]
MTSRSIPERGAVLHLGAAVALLCPACSPRQPSDEVNIADAAQTARESIGNYRGEKLGDRPGPAHPTAKRPAPAPSPTPPASTPAAAASAGAAEAEEPDAQAAVDVVLTYHRLIGQRRYDEAWSLWDREGAASGMSPGTFAASFAKYRKYQAEVGPPGRIDAGAGQRYVTVPVSVKGTLRDGNIVTLSGSMILHRAGPIDGATARQLGWRLYESTLKPRSPAPSAANPNTAP